MEIHNIDPVFSENSKILILGSFPSAASRACGFFYGHPQNRFWRVLSAVLEDKTPETNTEKRDLLLSHGIAIWDVIRSCDVTGSSDSKIKNVKPNDIEYLLSKTKVKAVYLNGKTAERLYEKYVKDSIDLPCFYLPSTSPANAGYSLEKLILSWKIILRFL